MPGLNGVVDMSHYQTQVDFGSLAAGGIQGVIHKATDGLGWTDPSYLSHRGAARAAGLMWGAYHFGEADDDGAAQAAYFLQTVAEPAGSHVLLALDMETAMSAAQVEAFVQAVQQKAGRWPLLYGGGLLKTLMQSYTGTVLQQCPLWLADYEAAPTLPAGWSQWTFWQYTDGVHGNAPQTTPGVSPACDRDLFNGDAAALKALWESFP